MAWPAAEWIRVTSSASSGSSGGRIDGRHWGEQRLSGAWPTDHQQVMATRRRDFQSSAAGGETPDDGEVGPDVVVSDDVVVIAERRHFERGPVAFALQRVPGLGQ